MKKLAIIILSIVLLVACVAVVACDNECETHDWGEWIETTPATCTENGVETRTCKKCGEKETQVAVARHKILDVYGNLYSCINVNVNASIPCSVCGEALTGDALIGAIEHGTTVAITSVSPTCTDTGLTEGVRCFICKATLVKQEEVPALGHNEVEAAATVATCTLPAYSAGTKCSRCGTYFSGHEETAPALGHDFSHGNYFSYVQCARDCGIWGKLTGSDPFETEFFFDFDNSKTQEIDELYEEIEAALKGTSSVSEEDFVGLFEQFDNKVSYIQEQYQLARIINDIEYNASSRAAFSNISSYYNTTVSRYYKLFKEINESSKYREYFWNWTEWNEDYIQYVLKMADSYDLDNRNAVDEIVEKYEDLLDVFEGTDEQYLELFNLYSQLVEANNNIAITAGYDNYMQYAYKEVYERDYEPEDVVAMREYVKEYIGPVLSNVANAYDAWLDAYLSRGGWSSSAAELYYTQFSINALWGNVNLYQNDPDRLGMILNSRQSVADYFAFLDNGDNSVHFFDAVNNLFKTGNVFLGENTNITAYTWYVYSTGTPILVFGGATNSSGGYSYRDTFTFVHEFGHYYQLVHNDLLSVPMDHDETQSQGNEMLFLAWLREHMPTGVSEGFNLLELEQLINMLGSVVLSTAVDEFEYLVYTGANTLTDGTTAIPMVAGADGIIDYAALYELILESYWDEIGDWFSTEYWMYVTFDNPAYYISYAMSALPCLELYAIAGNDGLSAARDSYLKLFTFSQNSDFIATDSFGDQYVTATYEEILNWAGLKGPFQKELYTTIQAFFASRS